MLVHQGLLSPEHGRTLLDVLSDLESKGVEAMSFRPKPRGRLPQHGALHHPAHRTRHRWPDAHRPQPQRHLRHHDPHRSARSPPLHGGPPPLLHCPIARQGGTTYRHRDARLHPPPASPAHHHGPLPSQHCLRPGAGRPASPRRLPPPQPQPHGCLRLCRHRLPHRPHPHGPTSRLPTASSKAPSTPWPPATTYPNSSPPPPPWALP